MANGRPTRRRLNTSVARRTESALRQVQKAGQLAWSGRRFVSQGETGSVGKRRPRGELRACGWQTLRPGGREQTRRRKTRLNYRSQSSNESALSVAWLQRRRSGVRRNGPRARASGGEGETLDYL